MDSSLINLIPNLIAARRATTLPRAPFIDPPPPYTLAPHPSPQRPYNVRPEGVPLLVEFLGPSSGISLDKRSLLWDREDSVALGPATDYWEFMAILRRKLEDLNVSKETGPWNASVVAETRGRTGWQFRRGVLEVEEERWGQVLEGLWSNHFRGLKVVCWRDD